MENQPTKWKCSRHNLNHGQKYSSCVEKKKKMYEINGVATYASIIYDEIEAYSKKEALKIAQNNDYSDPARSEFQERIIDEPILIPHTLTK